MQRKPIHNAKKVLSGFFSVLIFYSTAQNSPFLDSLLKTDLKEFEKVLTEPKYKLSLIYTRITRDERNKPDFTTYTYKTSSGQDYFYPASTVKLPVSLVAMAKLEQLKDKGVSKDTHMLADSAFICQKKILTDETSNDKKPSVGNYIKRMFLVSDNIACARTYEFIGCDYLHATLEKWAFENVRINNKLDGKCPGDTGKITPPVYFLKDSDTLYKQPLTFSSYSKAHPVSNSRVGKPYANAKGKVISDGKDFSKHNYLPISDLHEMMRRLVFNEYLAEKERLPLSKEGRLFLLRYLGMYPRESEDPKYDPKLYYDSFKKYFIYGSSVATIKGDSIRIFNIVGRAYGFLIDCAYIIDLKNKTEFLLTAGIYVNERDSFGTGKYEYDTIGLPFLKELSRSIYNYERKRKKQFAPDLTEFDLYGYH